MFIVKWIYPGYNAIPATGPVTFASCEISPSVIKGGRTKKHSYRCGGHRIGHAQVNLQQSRNMKQSGHQHYENNEHINTSRRATLRDDRNHRIRAEHRHPHRQARLRARRAYSTDRCEAVLRNGLSMTCTLDRRFEGRCEHVQQLQRGPGTLGMASV